MPRRYKAAMTAKEFLQALEADPDYVRRRAVQDEEVAKLDALYREAEAPLVSELAEIGFQVWSVWDLVNGVQSYDRAIPLLLHHLRRPYPEAIRDGIARALGVPATRRLGWRGLIDEYRQTDELSSRVKGGLAAALSAASDDSVVQDLIDLAKDRRNGASRVILLLGLRKSKLPEAKQALIDLAADPDLALEIRSWRKTSESTSSVK